MEGGQYIYCILLFFSDVHFVSRYERTKCWKEQDTDCFPLSKFLSELLATNSKILNYIRNEFPHFNDKKNRYKKKKQQKKRQRETEHWSLSPPKLFGEDRPTRVGRTRDFQPDEKRGLRKLLQVNGEPGHSVSTSITPPVPNCVRAVRHYKPRAYLTVFYELFFFVTCLSMKQCQNKNLVTVANDCC